MKKRFRGQIICSGYHSIHVITRGTPSMPQFITAKGGTSGIISRKKAGGPE